MFNNTCVTSNQAPFTNSSISLVLKAKRSIGLLITVLTVSFSYKHALSVLDDNPLLIDEDRFWFHSHEDFEANCDLKGDLYGKPSI